MAGAIESSRAPVPRWHRLRVDGMFTPPTSNVLAASHHRACTRSAAAVVILTIQLALAPYWLVSAAAQAPTLTAAGHVLDKVDRKIAKEPKYVATPRFALLV